MWWHAPGEPKIGFKHVAPGQIRRPSFYPPFFCLAVEIRHLWKLPRRCWTEQFVLEAVNDSVPKPRRVRPCSHCEAPILSESSRTQLQSYLWSQGKKANIQNQHESTVLSHQLADRMLQVQSDLFDIRNPTNIAPLFSGDKHSCTNDAGITQFRKRFPCFNQIFPKKDFIGELQPSPEPLHFQQRVLFRTMHKLMLASGYVSHVDRPRR